MEKRKKNVSPPFLMIFISLLIIFYFISCNTGIGTEIKKQEIPLSKHEKKEIAKYAEIGKKHNDALNAFYYNNKNESFNAHFGIDEQTKTFSIDFPSERSVKSVTPISVLEAEGFVSSDALGYMREAETLLINFVGTDIVSIQKQITLIEQKALKSLSENDLVQFMSYAETAKSSLEFWNEHYDALTVTQNKITQSKSAFSWLRRIGLAAASDAAGAAAGALVGVLFSPAYAEIGAVLAGAASSARAFETNQFSIVIPFTNNQNLLKGR